MTQKNLIKLFELKFLKGTCFDTLKELQKDRTSALVNLPRALIAMELKGVWRGLQYLNQPTSEE